MYRSYFVPYVPSRGEPTTPQKWRVNGEQLSGHVFQASSQHQPTLSGMSLVSELAKQPEQCVGTVMAPSALRNGLDSISVCVCLFSRRF